MGFKYFTIKSSRKIIRLSPSGLLWGTKSTYGRSLRGFSGEDMRPWAIFSRRPTVFATASATWRPSEGKKPCCTGFILLVTSTQRPRCSLFQLPGAAQTAFLYFPLHCPRTRSWSLDSDKLAFNPSFANRGCVTLFYNCPSLLSPSGKCRKWLRQGSLLLPIVPLWPV